MFEITEGNHLSLMSELEFYRRKALFLFILAKEGKQSQLGHEEAPGDYVGWEGLKQS